MKDRELRDDPPASGRPALPVPAELAAIDQVRSRNEPEIDLGARGAARGGGRRAPGRRGLSADRGAGARTSSTSTSRSASSSCTRAGTPRRCARRRSPRRAGSGGVAWVLSNHDFPRLATRLGRTRARGAALLLLTLPGPAFVYQGDEIGMVDGPGAEPPRRSLRPRRLPPPDAVGRVAHGRLHDRRAVAAAGRPGGAQRRRPAARPRLDPVALPAPDRAAARARAASFGSSTRRPSSSPSRAAEHLIAVNAGERPAAAPPHGEVLLASDGSSGTEIAPGEGVIARRRCLKACSPGHCPKRPLEADVNGRGEQVASSRRIKGVLVHRPGLRREPGAGMRER